MVVEEDEMECEGVLQVSLEGDGLSAGSTSRPLGTIELLHLDRPVLLEGDEDRVVAPDLGMGRGCHRTLFSAGAQRCFEECAGRGRERPSLAAPPPRPQP